MAKKKSHKIMSQRWVVQVLNANRPVYFSEEWDIDEKTFNSIMCEYDKIVERLRKNAVKNGGEFNQYGG